MNNIMPTGTLDNAGRLYHYVKSDFHYLDGSNGSFIVLKRESDLFEFFTRWIIWMILLIILVAIAAAWLINKRLTKTTIEPLEALEKKRLKTLGKDAQKKKIHLHQLATKPSQQKSNSSNLVLNKCGKI